MLREYAFTPHILDETANADAAVWQECMRSIAHAVWPDRDTACPVVVSGLHGDETDCTWRHSAAALVGAVADHVAKDLAQSLLARLTDLLVLRPACCDWPGDDEPPWLKEAVDTRRAEELIAILTSLSSVDPAPDGETLEAVRRPGFWGGLPQTVEPTGGMADQVSLLRPLLVHAEYYELSMPYPGLTDFTCAVIQEANRRPEGFATPEFDVYTMYPDCGAQEQVRRIRRQLPELVGTGRARWHFWPVKEVYRERVILAGRIAQIGDEQTKRGPRWGVAMTHGFGEGDLSKAKPATWSLLSEHGVMRHTRELSDAAAKPDVETLVL